MMAASLTKAASRLRRARLMKRSTSSSTSSMERPGAKIARSASFERVAAPDLPPAAQSRLRAAA